MTNYTVPAGRYGDYSTAFIQAYIDQKITDVIDNSPETLDTLNELAAAIGDDPAFFTSMATANAAIQADVDQNESDSDAADAALSARLDVLEADPTTAAALTAANTTHVNARAALQTLLQNAINAVQADVDTNEADADAAIATKLNLSGGELTGNFSLAKSFPDITLKSGDEKRILFSDAGGAATAALKHVSGSLDFYAGGIAAGNKEMSIDTDGVDVTALKIAGTAVTSTAAELNEVGDLGTFTGSTIADNQTVKQALQALETTLEAVDIDTDDLAALTGISENVTNLGTFTGSTIADNQAVKAALQALETAVELRATTTALNAVQADVDANEADADAAIALRAPLASPAFTGQHITHTAGDTQPTTHKIIGGFPDIILQTNQGDFATHQNEGRLLFNDAGAGSHGAIKMKLASSGTMDFFVGGITAGDKVMSIASDSVDVESLKIGGVAVTSTAAELNYCDGVTSNIQTQLDAIQADVDTNESDADTAIALKFDKTGGSITGNFDVAKSFPDITLKAGDERRILFSDAGGSAEGGFKFASNTLKIFAGGGIAGSNEAIALNGTTIETKDDLVQNPSASVTPAENGELMVEATNNTTLTFKLKGSDGTVRSGTITLS